MPPRSARIAMMRLPLVVLLTLGWFSAQTAAAQSRRRVAIVHPDEQLMRSLRIALSAWDIEVVSVEAPSPATSLPQAVRDAARIAKQARADIVAWVSDSDPGSVLWIYDAETDHVGLRVLESSRPFDQPTAAAAALSVKALLRSSSVAPVPDRAVATPESRPRSGAADGTSDGTSAEGGVVNSHQGSVVNSREGGVVNTHEGGVASSREGGVVNSHEGGVPSSREGGVVQRGDVPSPPGSQANGATPPVLDDRIDSSAAALPRPSLWIEAEAAGRVSPSVIAEPRGSFGVALWPRRLGDHAGCAIDVSGGVGVPIDTAMPAQVNARFYDWVASSSVRTRLRVGKRLALEPAVGASAHFTSLEGRGRQDAEPIAARRLDASLDAAISFDLEVGTVGIGARASMEYLVRYPRYLVDGEEVLTLMPFVVNLGVRLRAGIF